MELLVIGIDGGTKEIIDGMPMPFTQSLFKETYSRVLEEDLLSRGWAEALTGCHASETSGFYLMPFLDGSHNFNKAYSKEDMVAESPHPPIWEALNEKGVDVGVLNVPTTGPAAKVNGFLVAGGGGGLDSIGGLPNGMFYPDKIKETLLKNNYIFDIRLPGESKTVSEFIKKISSAEISQKDAFLELVKNEKPRFGLHCIRMITEIQYLARYEIDKCIAGLRAAKEQGLHFQPQSSVQESLMDYYKQVDRNIKDIFETLRPKEFLFVGDHSTALFKKDLNLDVWLEKNNYLRLANKFEAFYYRIKNSQKVANYLFRVKLRKEPWKKSARKPVTKFKPSKTLAFGTFFETGNIAGIFINDFKRFKGPVKTEAEIDKFVKEVCVKFNDDQEVQRHQLTAEPYRMRYKDSRFVDYMPDIKVSKPDTTYCSGWEWQFISDNPNLKPLEESLAGIKYPYSGLKGSDPLFVYSKNLENYMCKEDPNDLRLMYILINRFFQEK